MTTLPLPRHALVTGLPGMEPAGGWRLSRPAMVASILAHLALLLAAVWWYWNEAGVTARVDTRVVWVTALPSPVEPAVAPQPLEPAAPESVPAPIVAPRSGPPPATAPQPVPAPPLVEPAAEPVAPAAPEPAAGPTRLDLDAARREATAAVVREHERDRNMLELGATPPPERSVPAPRKPSIFDHQAGSSRSFLSPAKARTAVGQRLSLWCNKVTGGFGFFGLPICMSGRIEPPSGLFVESIPEYMKLKPECEESPLASTLGEAVPQSNVKCRLVPKAPGE